MIQNEIGQDSHWKDYTDGNPYDPQQGTVQNGSQPGRGIQMSVYRIPLKYKAGEFKFSELNTDMEKESLNLDYDTEHQLITYSVPMYKNSARIYTVPRDLMPDGLTAVYNDAGELDKVVLAGKEDARLLYIRFKNINASRKGILKFVKEQADQMCTKILGKKQTLSRLFFGKFYDGEAVEIAVKTATAEEIKAVIDKYDDRPDTIDNSGNYPVENMVMLDYEPLAVMLMCTSCDFQSMLFDLAAAAVEERIRSRLLNKINKTDDFKYLSEEWD